MIDMRNDMYRPTAARLPTTGQFGTHRAFYMSPTCGCPTLYLRYDERYVYSAPDLASKTRRIEWSPESPALASDVTSTLGL